MFISIFIIITFFIAEQYHIPLLHNPDFVLHQGGIIAALTGIALLVADVLIPVPSSLIMIANGAVFGIWMGTLLSMIGGVLSSLAGFYLGKNGSTVVNKFIPLEEQARAKHIMTKWGMLAVIITRPVPVLAESVSIIAGTTQMKLSKLFFASALGVLPAAIIYAVTGAYSIDTENRVLSFVLVVAVGGIFWGVGQFKNRKVIKSKTTL